MPEIELLILYVLDDVFRLLLHLLPEEPLATNREHRDFQLRLGGFSVVLGIGLGGSILC